MKAIFIGILCVFVLLLSTGCGGPVTPGDDSSNGVQTVQVGYEVTGTSSAATVMIADNNNNTTLYFANSSAPGREAKRKRIPTTCF